MGSFYCEDCDEEIEGTDSAYELARNSSPQWKDVPYVFPGCECGYPIRPFQVKDQIFTNFLDSDKEATSDAYIFCSNSSGEHVYYGTFENCVRGNGVSAKQFELDSD